MAKKKKPPREKAESGLKVEEMKNLQSESTEIVAPASNKPIIPESKVLPDDVYCPSCGRFVGAYDRCPYCQASMEVRMGLKVARRVAVFGAIIGLILLWFAARAKKVDTIQIGEISVNHNMALVRLEGQVVNVRLTPEKNNFSITIDDDTGTMKLGGFDKLKSFQEHFGDGFPQIGDRVEVEGNLSNSEQWGASMFLSIPRRLNVLKKFQPDKRTIASLTGDDVGSVVEITADVIGVRTFPPKNPVHRALELKDTTGSLSLTLFESDYNKFADQDLRKKLTTAGHQFILQVIVDEYKDQLQLKLRDPANAAYAVFVKTVKVEPSAVAPQKKWEPKEVSIAEVDKSMENKLVTVEGTMESARETEWGVNLQLKDDSGPITIWISKNAAKNVMKEPVMFAQGTRLKVTGKVGLYNDILQIKPFKAGDIAIVGGN